MHNNAQVINTLYTSLNKHDHQSMADFYHPEAIFEDIAFKLDGKKQIHAMWGMICIQDGLIIEHHDVCDPKIWAEQALGGGLWISCGEVSFSTKTKSR